MRLSLRCPLPGTGERGDRQVPPRISLFPGEGPRAALRFRGRGLGWWWREGQLVGGGGRGLKPSGLHPFPPSPRGGPGADTPTAQVNSACEAPGFSKGD